MIASTVRKRLIQLVRDAQLPPSVIDWMTLRQLAEVAAWHELTSKQQDETEALYMATSRWGQ